jgi:formylglycine-generating enzyme required for sulfatase activity
VDVSWEEANDFCVWLNAQNAKCKMQNAKDDNSAFCILHSAFRLPTEAEWEHAARGADGCAFPWGDAWDERRANTRDGGPGGTTPVGNYLAGASPYDGLDLAGNVWEWTSSLDMLYPYDPSDGREDAHAPGRRILRGGCYANPHGFARCACRFRLLPNVRNTFLGFRLACSWA